MITLASIFTDNMVLQREKPIAIFGTSDQDETISVHLMKSWFIKSKYQREASLF
ncbi:hypothetical protein [Globicatella sp. HMSC072A10]|uniref:hypothetical protein n=1 Tax=Globicatella sp. HMSC072A10 TaxID=1739315 RepID=UPI000AF03AAF|nr:hypothetical protein [Globicatella sp. HMSC072A10]